MDNRSNEVLFDEEGNKAGASLFRDISLICLDLNAVKELIQDALDSKSGTRNLTGNTITSVCVADYSMDGGFTYFERGGDSMETAGEN